MHIALSTHPDSPAGWPAHSSRQRRHLGRTIGAQMAGHVLNDFTAKTYCPQGWPSAARPNRRPMRKRPRREDSNGTGRSEHPRISALPIRPAARGVAPNRRYWPGGAQASRAAGWVRAWATWSKTGAAEGGALSANRTRTEPQHPIQPNLARPALRVPGTGAHLQPMPAMPGLVGGVPVMVLRGQHQPEQVLAIPADDQHRPVLAATRSPPRRAPTPTPPRRDRPGRPGAGAYSSAALQNREKSLAGRPSTPARPRAAVSRQQPGPARPTRPAAATDRSSKRHRIHRPVSPGGSGPR